MKYLQGHNMNLKNQNVVILGGSSGIGLARAEAALAGGERDVVASRSKEKLKKNIYITGKIPEVDSSAFLI